ncbi:hypothetical protein DPMN_101693 [Dreissena polymorpha]|uniref:Uncharacterized protein n=1 Tax=Dreissena polymorpha TaxID=45954 RepID=A0A9D4LKD6_DREPO|nr:hypothetical protein DPMN_101693 [Dreissena polymorpha]
MPYIIGTNLLTKFHEDRKINVASRVFTRFYYSHNLLAAMFFNQPASMNLLTEFHEDRTINVASRVLTSYMKTNAPPPGGHVFEATETIFELIQDIIGTNLLTKFHEDQKINVASRVKNAPPLGSYVFQANLTIFELIRDIIETNLLTKLHDDRAINVASRVLTRTNAPPLAAMFF